MYIKIVNHVVKFICFFILSFSLSLPLQAATHSLTKWDAGKFDLVVSLGWTPSSADKTKLESVFKLFAKDVYTMSEGNHSIRRLYVYTPDTVTNKARDWEKADIRFLNTADAANATIAGFKKVGRIFIDDDLSDLDEAGHALAHELGHYAYAIYDEYKDNQGPSPGFPHTNDTPKNSIMNQHWTWQNFSVAADYSDEAKQKTAHYRMYGESIWETLISDIALDSLWAEFDFLGYKNKRFTFTDLQALASVPSPLTKPTDNPDVDIIYMGGSEACIIIDRSGSMSSDNKMASAISGAKSYLDKLAVDKDYAAVVAFDDYASTIGPLGLLDAAKKSAFKVAISGLSSDYGGTSFDAALSAGYTTLSGSTRKGTFKYIVLLSDGMAPVPTAVLQQLKNENIPVYTIGLGSGADMSALSQIATGTNGKSYYAATAASLNAIYSDISSISTDAKLTARIKENLNISKNTATNTILVDSSCKKALFSSSFPPGDTMTFEITKPDGTTMINAGNVDLFANIELIAESGYATYQVTAPEAGTWTATLVATGLTGDSEVIIEGKTDSDYSINTIVQGGIYPDPILLVATVSKDYPVSGLDVSANVTAPDGTISTLLMHDDGLTPDVTADDGQYACAISSYSDGDYQFDVVASNSAGNAVETSKSVSLKNGTATFSQAVGENFAAMTVANLKTTGPSVFTSPTTIGTAAELTVNGDKTSGIIENDGDISHYYFNMINGTSYTIYTSGLFPDTMETLVTLYESDTLAAPVAEDSNSMNKGSAKIIYDANEDGMIYITVKHGSTGTGTFDIAVRETQPTDSKSQPTESPDGASSESSGGGSSSGGGCFMDSLTGH